MTVLSKFCRLTDPELTCWSKLPQEMLQMVLKQPEITTRENFDACMREFKYGRRCRQYETFAELFDPTQSYNGDLFFGHAYLRLLPYRVNFQGRRTARRTVQCVDDVLRYEGMYRRTKPLNVFGIPLQSWEFNNNVELHFSDYCTHAELDDAIANNQLSAKVRRGSSKKKASN